MHPDGFGACRNPPGLRRRPPQPSFSIKAAANRFGCPAFQPAAMAKREGNGKEHPQRRKGPTGEPGFAVFRMPLNRRGQTSQPSARQSPGRGPFGGLERVKRKRGKKIVRESAVDDRECLALPCKAKLRGINCSRKRFVCKKAAPRKAPRPAGGAGQQAGSFR